MYAIRSYYVLGKIKGLLGGRAAEELVFGEVSTGAANDLETTLANVLPPRLEKVAAEGEVAEGEEAASYNFV